MKRSSETSLLLISLCWCIVTHDVTRAQAGPVLRALDFVPADVSADGSVVASGGGWVTTPPFLWNSATGGKTEIGLFQQGLPVTAASRISADRSVVVGSGK